MANNMRMRSTTPTNVTSENLATIVRDTLAAEATIERNYAGLVQHYGLAHDASSEAITAAAHAAVLAAYPDTDPDRLKGKNKNHDQRWKDARKIRAGLVRALKALAPAPANDDNDNDDNDTTDYVAMIRNAVQQATAHGVSADRILEVVTEVLV